MALTVEDLYQQYAGRTPDAEGLAFWQAGFGSEITPAEIESFKQSVGITKAEEIVNSTPNLSSGELLTAMQSNNISPEQMAQALNVPVGQVVSTVAEALPPGQAAFLGGTVIQPVYEQSSLQGIDAPASTPLQEILVYTENQQTGDAYKQYTPTGEYIKSGQFKDVGGLGSLLKDMGTAIGPIALAAATAGGAGGLLGSSLGLTGTAANVAGGALLGGGGAALTGGDVLQGALLGGAGGYLQGAGGVGIETDASFLANDAAQLANQGISQSQIVDILSAPGYASTAAANLAASMAVNGLDVGTITNQLDALSSNTGLYQQNLSQGEFGAYDALGLKDVVGNDFAAIEQNLVASGVDPLVAADISQQLAFNPNITQSELASNLTNSFGNNIYDVNVATTYPTSVLPGSGGFLSDVAGTTGATATTGTTGTTGTAGTGITPGKILDAVKIAGVVAGIGGSVTDTGQTGFDIVPVPSDWKTPTYGQITGPVQGLAPINFGSRELLRGTQWEKYINPIQPAAVQSPQTGMNYNQLINTLQGGQGGSLTLSDIISGIQGQYGQTSSGTVG